MRNLVRERNQMKSSNLVGEGVGAAVVGQTPRAAPPPEPIHLNLVDQPECKILINQLECRKLVNQIECRNLVRELDQTDFRKPFV